jgi:uncharacterized protein (TIGR03067 family)
MQFTRRGGWRLWLVVAGVGFSALAEPHSVPAEEPKERASFGGHNAVVSSVAITADGKTLASGSYDTTIKLWDLATGKETTPLRGHTAGVYSIAFAPDGKTLASGSHDDTARLWDVASGKEIAILKHAYHVKRVVFTPDGKTLITAGEGPIKLWDVATAAERAILDLVMQKANANLVLSMAVTPDGKVLCTGHGDGNLKLWDLTTRKEVTSIRTNDKPSERHVPSVAITADGKTLACGIGCGAVKFWDVTTWQEQHSIDAHRARVWGLAISPDGKMLASGAWDGAIKFWDLSTGKERASFRAHDNRIYALAFTPDGKTLVSGGGIQFKRGEVKLWDVVAILKLSGDKSAQAGDEAAKLLQGKWRVMSAKQNGAPFPKDWIEKMFVVFEKDEIRVYLEGTKSEQGATFTVDAKQNPKHIDFTKETRDREWADKLPWKLFRRYKWTDGEPVPAEGKAEGIYKLEGDSLTLCWRTTEGKEILGDKVSKELKVRPSVFQSQLYYHQFLFVLERVKCEK